MLSTLGALKTYIIMNKNIIDERISSISKMRKEIKRLEKALLQADSRESENEVRKTLILKNMAMRNTVNRLQAAIDVAVEIDEYIHSLRP